MRRLLLLTGPAEEPVSLAEAKLHLRLDADHTVEDTLIGALIVSAREQAEHLTGRALVTQQWRLMLEAFPVGAVELPRPPLQSVQDISFTDLAGDAQVLTTSAYLVDPSGVVGSVLPVYGQPWPVARREPGAVRIDYTAGFGGADDVPQSIKGWMLLAIGTMYAQREAIAAGARHELPRAFWDGLLDPWRIYR